jgi:hypothetical protein
MTTIWPAQPDDALTVTRFELTACKGNAVTAARHLKPEKAL